jgi:hypothetical protein
MAEISFEQRFGQLVDAELNERLPSLVEYRVGFQIIDKTDDDTKAVGIYAFVVNNVWLYIPIFFIKGALEGFELLYIKNKDMFVPATDTFIAAINDQGVQILGSTATNSEINNNGLGASSENTNTFSPDSSIFKLAASSFGNNSFLEKEAVDNMFKRLGEGVEKQYLPSLDGALEALPKEASSLFVNTFLKDPEFANALFQVHSLDHIEKVAKQAIIYRDVIPVVEPNKVIYIKDKLSKEAKELDDNEKKLLVKNGIYIKDHRTNFTKVFHEEVDSGNFQNPTSPGIYDVLLKDGTLEKYIIVKPNRGADGHCKNTTSHVALIPIDSSHDFFWVKAADVFAKPTTGLDRNKIENKQGGMKASARSIRDIKDMTSLLFVHSTHNVIKADLSRYASDFSGNIYVNLYDGLSNRKEMLVVFTDEGKLIAKEDKLYVPSDDCRMFVQNRKSEPKYGMPSLFSIKAYTSKGLGCVEVNMGSNANYGSLTDANGNTPFIPKEAMAKILCEGYGIEGQDVIRMLKEAHSSPGHKKRYLYKESAAFNLNSYRDSSFKPFMGGPRGKEKQPIVETIQTKKGKAILPQEAINKAQEAAGSGIKEVLDVSVIKQLVDKADISELRKDYTSALIKGLDALGRLLFLYYWHNDAFEDRHGKDKMKELHSHLKEVFLATGDLVIFLKEKTTFHPDQAENTLGNLSTDIATAHTE